jgi:hypothetical protein
MRKHTVAAAVALAFSLTGCGGDGGTSTLSLSITDAPVDEATTVWVQFTGVELKRAGGPPETITFDAPKGYDLLTLQNGNAATLLDDTTVPAGEYEWLRLMPDPAPGSSYVIDDSGQHDLVIPSGAQTGLKLVRGFTMPAGGRADFTIDFVLQESIIAPPGQSPDYKMKPVLRMTNNVETGSIAGKFLTPDAAAICDGAAPSLYLFTGADVTPDDLYNPLEGAPDTAPDVDPLVTTQAVMNGVFEYRFSYVQAGTYTLAVTCDEDDPAVDENATTPLAFFLYPDPLVVTAGQTTTADF